MGQRWRRLVNDTHITEAAAADRKQQSASRSGPLPPVAVGWRSGLISLGFKSQTLLFSLPFFPWSRLPPARHCLALSFPRLARHSRGRKQGVRVTGCQSNTSQPLDEEPRRSGQALPCSCCRAAAGLTVSAGTAMPTAISTGVDTVLLL